MNLIKEGYLYLERKILFKKTWEKRWFMLFRKYADTTNISDEIVFYYKNNENNLDDDYIVTFIEIITITDIKYLIKNGRKAVELQYSFKNNENYQFIYLSADNNITLSEWCVEILKARDSMIENIQLDNYFISKIQSCPFFLSTNPRYNKPELFSISSMSSDVNLQDDICINDIIFCIGTLQFPPSLFPFKHGVDVALSTQNDAICLKPAVLTLGEFRQKSVTWPLMFCSHFGISSDCFYFEIDETNISSSPSGIFSIRCENPNNVLKNILNYCKNYNKPRKHNRITSFFDSLKSKHEHNRSMVDKTRNNSRQFYLRNNSIYNRASDETLNGRSVLKPPKRFLTLKRTKNN